MWEYQKLSNPLYKNWRRLVIWRSLPVFCACVCLLFILTGTRPATGLVWCAVKTGIAAANTTIQACNDSRSHPADCILFALPISLLALLAPPFAAICGVFVFYIGIPFVLAYLAAFRAPAQTISKAETHFQENAQQVDQLIDFDRNQIIGQAFIYDWTLCASLVKQPMSNFCVKKLGQEIYRVLPCNKNLPRLVLEYALDVRVICEYMNTTRKSVIYRGLNAALAEELVPPGPLLQFGDDDSELGHPGIFWNPEEQTFVDSMAGLRNVQQKWLLHVSCPLSHETLCKLID